MTAVAKRTLLFAFLLLWCALLIGFRTYRTKTPDFFYLFWNLFLAVIPAFAAAMFARGSMRGTNAAVRSMWVVIWILFLPNAPYIITDFIHLGVSPKMPLWYDIALLLSCAATGLLLGYSSVADVHSVVRRSYGDAAGWAVAAIALFLSGFGIYVGRFLRWNSWDAIAQPAALVRQIVPHAKDPLALPRTIGVTLIYGAGLVVGYIALRVFAATFGRWGRR